MHPTAFLPSPHTTLAVIGGGQLGRMFCHSAQTLGFRTLVFTPDADSPAGQVADAVIQAPYDDLAALDELAMRADAITIEFENIPIHSLHYLAQKNCRLSPAPNAVAIAQNRILEKEMMTQLGLPTAPYAIFLENEFTPLSNDFFPAIVKTATQGYDGKGQIKVDSNIELQRALTRLNNVACVCEKKLPLVRECSVLLARNERKDTAHYEVLENIHRDGILIKTLFCRSGATVPLHFSLIQSAYKIATHLNYCGVLCVEFFILPNDTWVVNEIAPRPHNSGHITMDACHHSQFEQQVRVLAGLPIASATAHSDGMMFNLLGDLWPAELRPAELLPDEAVKHPAWDALLALPDTHLHLYGKTHARPGRKMGHLSWITPNASLFSPHLPAIESVLASFSQ